MPLGHKKILPAVIVKVEKAHAPSRMRKGHPPEAGSETVVGKTTVSAVFVKGIHLVGQVVNHHVRQTVIVVVGKVHSHPCERAAVCVDGHLGKKPNFFKRSIPFIAIEKFEHRVVGQNNIHMSIPVVIRERNAQPLARL